MHSVRQPLGVVGIISPFNFPAMVPMWFYPHRHRRREHRGGQAQREGPDGVDLDRRAVARGRTARRGLQRAQRGQGRRRRAAHPSRRGLDLLRRVHPDRPLHLRDRDGLRQAGAGPRRGQEPHAGAAGRRPRPGRGPGGQRRLRVGGGALHGDLGRAGRRGDRRHPGRQDRRAGPVAAHRRRDPRLRHGPAGHRPGPGPGGRLRRRRRGGRGAPGGRRAAAGGGRRRRRVLRRADAVRPGDAGHEHLHRRDLRAGAVGGPGGQLRRGREADQRQPVRQRGGDLHQRRRGGPAVLQRGQRRG